MKKLKDVNVELVAPECRYECAQHAYGIYENTTHIIGFGFDGTACFRKGTFAGPDALRAVSDGIESYSPYLDADIEEIQFVDLGNLSIDINHVCDDQHQLIEQQWQQATNDYFTLFADVDFVKTGVKTLMLGGEHSVSYAPIKTYLAQYPDLVVIHLDAHADLRDGYLGFHYSHAAIIRRIVEHFGKQHQLIQYGIRSGTKEEYQWMHSHQTLYQSRASFLSAIADIDNQRPIYLTLDLDYFDPSFFPGTGTPEPGGEDFHSFISLCKLLKEKNFVGCDVVELSPEIDPTGNSDVFATKVVRELLICLNT
ncbi:agmatinase [Thalassotalea insulae]|uniref:agmatinase n=1 Tax=Thalassotalea insulae TaxID=2056778 RepID=UPI0024E0C7A7|nr:agmatinase [Thalassotalea insulae]